MTRPRINTDELRNLLGEVTPGKWVATMTHPTNACAHVDQADGYVSIATCYGGDEGSEQDEHGMWSSQPRRDANATLIALAPEMADELIRLRAHAEAMAEAAQAMTDLHNGPPSVKRPDVFQLRIAALAAALTAYRTATKEQTDE